VSNIDQTARRQWDTMLARNVFRRRDHVTISQSRTVLAASAFLLLSSVPSTQSQTTPQISPADLVKAVIGTELNTSQATEIRWKYRLDEQMDGKDETREVVETRSGSLDRLIAIGGRPLNSAKQRDETERILRLSHDPEQQRKLEESRRKDAEQCNRFLQMIPDAFLFEYAGTSGDLVKVTFKPSPNFQPPSREGKILHQMAGDIWIHPKQQRLVSIDGRLTNDIKFGGGLLGHLQKGGEFKVRRTEIAPDQWELTEMTVNMQGRALLFKAISVKQKEVHSDFQPVREDLSFSDAAALLLRQTLVAVKR
jgi:hypothetical protein